MATGSTHGPEIIDIPGGQGVTSVVGGFTLVYKLLQDGELIKRKRGVFEVPLKGGATGEIRARGFVPGHQKLYFNRPSLGTDPTLVYDHGQGTPKYLVWLSFLPVLLVIANPLLGLIFGVISSLQNLFLIKMPQVPFALKIGMPILTTVFIGFALYYAF